MNYELRPLTEFTLIDRDAEQQSNGDSDKSRLLLEFNNALISQVEFEDLLKAIFEHVKRVFRQATAAILALHEPSTNELRIHLLHSDDPDLFREGMLLSLEHTPSGLAFRTRQTVVIKKLAFEDFPSPQIKPVANCLRRVINHDAASVVLLDQVTGQLRIHMLDRPPGGILDEGSILPMDGTPPGLCIKLRKAIKRDTIDFNEFYVPQMRMAYAAGLRCGFSVPLIAHDQILGAINVGAFHEYAFTDEDVELLEQIAKPVAVAIENALNLKRAESERDRFQLMLEINNAVVSHLNLQDLVKTISASLRDIMPHDAAGIALYEPEHNHLREYTNVFYTEVAAFRVGDTIPLEGTPAGQVFTTGKPLLVKRPDLDQYPADRYSREPVQDSPKSACLALISTHGRKLGIAGVSSTKPDNFTEKDLELFTHVCDQIAIAVQNSLNFEAANRERVRAQMLLEINNAITTNLDLHALIQATSACLRDYFQHDFAGVALYDDEINQLIVHSIDLAQPDKYLVAGKPFDHKGTLTGLAFTSREPVVRNRFDPNETTWSMARKFHDEHGLRSMCFIPMIWGDRNVGVLNLGCR